MNHVQYPSIFGNRWNICTGPQIVIRTVHLQNAVLKKFRNTFDLKETTEEFISINFIWTEVERITENNRKNTLTLADVFNVSLLLPLQTFLYHMGNSSIPTHQYSRNRIQTLKSQVHSMPMIFQLHNATVCAVFSNT